jgi:cell division protein FtsW (lipid II flippase)
MNKRDEYLDATCRQVRFRAARKYLRTELSAHIDDKKAYLEQSSVTDAETAAVKAMGDPVQTGRDLNAIHKPRVEWRVIVCVLLLCAAGLFTWRFGNTGGPASDGEYWFWHNFSSYLMPIVISLALMGAVMFLDYTWLAKLRYVLFGAGLIYIAVYIVFESIDRYGETFFWFGHGWFGSTAAIVVPAILLILGMAGFANRHRQWNAGNIALLLGLCIVSILAMRLMSALYAVWLTTVYCTLIVVAIVSSPLGKTQRWLSIVSCVLVLSVTIALGLELMNAGNHAILESTGRYSGPKSMLSSAQLIGPSPEFALYGTRSLDASRTGYVLTTAIIAYGWLFGIAIIAVFAAMLALMMHRSLKTEHLFGRLLSVGVSAYFAIRFVLFVLLNLGLLEGLSVHLPFVSFGDFNHLTDAALVGVFLSVWRRSSFMPRDAAVSAAAWPSKHAAPEQPIQ